jgi:hypothetical protein
MTTSQAGKKKIQMRANNKAAMREHLYDCSFSNAIEGRGGGSSKAEGSVRGIVILDRMPQKNTFVSFLPFCSIFLPQRAGGPRPDQNPCPP